MLATKNALVFILLSVCFLFALAKYAPSPRLTYDSHAYIEASQSVDTYFHGKNIDGHTYFFRPPVIPLCLHFFQNKVMAAKWLNAICFVLSLWLCYFIGREFKLEPIFLSLFIASVISSYPWLQNHFFVWSEPLFSALLLLLVWLVLRESSWVLLAIICAVLFLTRKAGLFISAGVVLEFLFRGEYRKAIQIGLVVGTIFITWELLTFFYSGENIMQLTFLDLADESRWHWFDAITAWFIPRNIPLSIRTGIAVLISIFLFFFKRKQELHSNPVFKTLTRLLLFYVLIFVIFLGVPEFGEADRYLSVIIPIAMLLLVAFIQRVHLETKYGKYFLGAFTAWMIYPIGRTLYHLL